MNAVAGQGVVMHHHIGLKLQATRLHTPGRSQVNAIRQPITLMLNQETKLTWRPEQQHSAGWGEA